MEYILEHPVQLYSKDAGDYVEASKVAVSFTGKKGAIKLKSLQDVIFQVFQDTAKKSTSDKAKEKEDQDVKAEDILSMLEMTGNSERIFVAVTDSLQYFATIDGQKLKDDIQDQMDSTDLENIYQEVLKSFLLPKVTQMMNSMKK